MNKNNRSEINNIIKKLEAVLRDVEKMEDIYTIDSIIEDITEVKDDEDYKFSNLSEGLQQTENGIVMENAVQLLEDSIDKLEDINSINDTLNSVISNLREIE